MMESSIFNSAAIKNKQASNQGQEKQAAVVLLSVIVNKCVQYCASIGKITKYLQNVQNEQYMNNIVQIDEQQTFAIS